MQTPQRKDLVLRVVYDHLRNADLNTKVAMTSRLGRDDTLRRRVANELYNKALEYVVYNFGPGGVPNDLPCYVVTWGKSLSVCVKDVDEAGYTFVGLGDRTSHFSAVNGQEMLEEGCLHLESGCQHIWEQALKAARACIKKELARGTTYFEQMHLDPEQGGWHDFTFERFVLKIKQASEIMERLLADYSQWNCKMKHDFFYYS